MKKWRRQILMNLGLWMMLLLLLMMLLLGNRLLGRGVHGSGVLLLLLRRSRCVQPRLRLQLGVVDHTGRRMLHTRRRGRVRMLRIVLLWRVTGRRIARRRCIRIVIITTGGRCGLERLARRIRGRSLLLLLGLLAGVARS